MNSFSLKIVHKYQFLSLSKSVLLFKVQIRGIKFNRNSNLNAATHDKATDDIETLLGFSMLMFIMIVYLFHI